MGLISSLFGGKAAQAMPAEPKRKNVKPRTKSNKPNKLSKPRTNTSANNLLDVPGGGVSRKSSLASVNARGKRRSSSVPARSDVDLPFTEDVEGDAGLGRGRQQERNKRASRLSSLFRSKSSTPASIVLQDRPDDKWILDDNGGVESLDNADPLRRYSQLGLAGYAQDLPTDSNYSVTDITPDLHRSPSYIRYQQARLSLVAETSSAVQINDVLRRQRLAETEAILTRNASVHSQNSNASNRYSMRSSTSPALSARMSSTEQVHIQPENYTSHSACRRSHLTPGVATRMGEANKGSRSSRLQKQNPKARRQSAAEPESSQTFTHHFERSKTLPSEEEIYSYYDQDKASESPVEDLEMLAPLQKPRFREDLTSTQRMSTPTDLRHIGSFELGSLRITNGVATPNAANTPKARRAPSADIEADNVSSRTTAISLASLARRHPSEQGKLHEAKQPRQPEITVNPADHLTVDPPSRSPSTATKLSAYSDMPAISRASSQLLETAPQIPGGASEFADFYRLDIDFLPSLFSADLSMPSTPKLETSSKRTSEEDELFEDARSQLGVFEDAESELGVPDRRSPISEPPRRQDDELYLPAVETMSQRRPAQTMDTSTHARLERLAVPDSGYSSYTSLGSVQSSGSQSKLRDASESPTELDDYQVARPAEFDVSSKPRVPKADYWRTQHAPSELAREYCAEPIAPPPVRAAPFEPQRSQMPRPPIPMTAAAHVDESLESQPEAELTKSTSKSAPTSPKRASLTQSRSPGKVLQKQKSSRHRPNSLAAQSRANSEDTITPVKKKWHRHSTQSSSETPITVQKIEEPEKTKVPPVPKRLSLTFKERASRFSSGLKHTTTVLNTVEPAKEEEPKPAPPPSKEEVQRSIRRQSSPAMPGIRLVAGTSSHAPAPAPTPSSKSPRPLSSPPPKNTNKDPRSPPKDTTKDPRADFERHITNATTITSSLGNSPYDAGASAIAPAPADPAANTTRPRRDRTGRLIGMDEESASNFARARSQVRAQERAQEAERREALVSRMAQSISEGSDGRAPPPVVVVPNNSSFANQLAIASHRTPAVPGVSTAAGNGNVPPVPTLASSSLNVPEARQSPLMKGKREKIGPPPSLMNDRNRKHGILGFWSGSSSSGSSSKDGLAIDVPKRPMPMGPVGSSGEIPAIVSAKSAGFTTPGGRSLPSMAPQWRGPSPAELAEMVLKARKEGRASGDGGRRSMSANGVYEKGKGVERGGERPGSVMSESEPKGKGRRRGWSFRSRKEGEV
ncbi:hypothetical protein VF21_01740 [Pseudogymnoascus sp. 05NY08]|nr:hypothetical protein VF21_01740 [Pseudogymnoascus sp. 05NY08]